MLGYNAADSPLLIIHENSTDIYLFGDFISFSTAASPALRVVGVYWSSSQQSLCKGRVTPRTNHQFIAEDFVGGLLITKCRNMYLLCLFLPLDPCESYTLVLWSWNQSAIPHSECRVFLVLIRCQECTPERTPGIWLLLNMRSSDFIVFGRQGQTKIQPCLST